MNSSEMAILKRYYDQNIPIVLNDQNTPESLHSFELMNANFICLEIRIFDDKKGKIRKINVIKACERKLNLYLQKGSSSFFKILGI